MEHAADSAEMRVMSTVDFIVPLKQVGIITRCVLEAVHEFYKPRRIIVVTKKAEAEILRILIPFWDVGLVECLDEDIFFVKNFGLSLDNIISEYDATRPGDQREPGWWIQQLIKLGAATQIENISPTYVVWDGDLVPSRRWKLCSVDPVSGSVQFHIAILQGESRSEFNTTQYANCMRALTGFTPLEPVEGGTFVAHHMVFQTKYVNEMLDLMAEKTQCTKPWPLMIMAASKKFYRFSEYKTYATFMLKTHPEEFHYHELSMFGEGGLRFREANSVVDDMLKVCKIKEGGLPFAQVKGYVNLYWKTLTTLGQCMPAYIQLDHVYGLAGFNLNMSTSSYQTPSSSSSSSSSSSTSVETSLPSKCVEASNDAVIATYASSCPSSSSSSSSSSLSSSLLSSLSSSSSSSILSPSLALTAPIKPTIFHCIFPSKRPRFIVQR